jgi:hypothetical protein
MKGETSQPGKQQYYNDNIQNTHIYHLRTYIFRTDFIFFWFFRSDKTLAAILFERCSFGPTTFK